MTQTKVARCGKRFVIENAAGWTVGPFTCKRPEGHKTACRDEGNADLVTGTAWAVASDGRSWVAR